MNNARSRVERVAKSSLPPKARYIAHARRLSSEQKCARIEAPSATTLRVCYKFDFFIFFLRLKKKTVGKLYDTVVGHCSSYRSSRFVQRYDELRLRSSTLSMAHTNIAMRTWWPGCDTRAFYNQLLKVNVGFTMSTKKFFQLVIPGVARSERKIEVNGNHSSVEFVGETLSFRFNNFQFDLTVKLMELSN